MGNVWVWRWAGNRKTGRIGALRLTGAPDYPFSQGRMILRSGEKIHVIHRRMFDKDQHRHFIGTVEAYESGVARVVGNVYTVDTAKFQYIRRPETRTRIISMSSGDVLVNVVPPHVNLDKIVYKQEKKGVRVTDGSDWFLDISEFSWK